MIYGKVLDCGRIKNMSLHEFTSNAAFILNLFANTNIRPLSYQRQLKRRLLLGRKAMINLDSKLKNRDIILLTKVHIVHAMVFPVVKYGCEIQTIKKAEHRRIDAFELWYWRRLLKVPWTARRSNQPILKNISPEYSCQRWQH